MHCDVNPAPLPRVTGACHPVGRVKSDQIFKIRHSLTFSTIIPVSHVTIHSSIASKATRKRGIFRNHTAFVQEVSPWLMSPFVCKRFCPQFVNVDSGENREVIPPENVLNWLDLSRINQKCPKLIRSNCRLPGSTNFQLRQIVHFSGFVSS